METTSTVTYMSPDVTIDLNERFNKFMVQRMDAYEEPKCRREGRPFLPIYAASILALTDIPLADQAKTVGAGYKALKSARTTEKFKALVKEHSRDFGMEVFCHILLAAMDRKACATYAANEGKEFEYGNIRWGFGNLSWDGFIGLLASFQCCFKDWKGCREAMVKQGVLSPQFTADVDSTLLLIILHRDFLPVALSMARQHYKVSKREVDAAKSEFFNGLLTAFSQAILTIARQPEEEGVDVSRVIESFIQHLISEHDAHLPKLTRLRT